MAPFNALIEKDTIATLPFTYPFFLTTLSRVGKSHLLSIPDLKVFPETGHLLFFGQIDSI